MEVLVPSLFVVIVGAGRAAGSSNSSSSAQSGRLLDMLVNGKMNLANGGDRLCYFGHVVCLGVDEFVALLIFSCYESPGS